jgi:tripartite-type tricarboxylate transporter receptor subunit TctC
VATILCAPPIRRAEAYPAGPIRVIVPGAPGGMVDLAARAVGEVMQRELGQPWLIDSRPGASGIIGAKTFLDASSDNPVLYLTVLSHVLLPFVMKVPFDVIADFQPVAMLGTSGFLLCVPAVSPASTVAGFVDCARAHAGQLNYLNPGNGTMPHLLTEMLKIRFGIDITGIYYKAIPQGILDLVAGNLDLGLLATGQAMPQVQQGRLKAIAQVSRHRVDVLPGVATLAEQGLDDLQVEAFLPLYGRTSMPAATVARINRAMAAALADGPTRERLAANYIEPLPLTPAEVGTAMRREHDRLGAVIRQLGITADGRGGNPS